MFNTQSLVSQKAALSLCSGFLCRGFLTVVNLALSALSFGSQLHSFWLWTCVCVMHLRRIHFKKMYLKIIVKQ
ncbi:Uncharacterised protein [Vibrio cholerae]|nr:Uncharacterised protein [Vibrio cholerae]CSD99242.1 Uncharacterised protein [Vibrio cholerae]